MKKTLRILSLLLIAAMLFAFAACGNTPDNGENGSTENDNNNDGGNTNKEYAKLNVGVLKGPTGVGPVSSRVRCLLYSLANPYCLRNE